MLVQDNAVLTNEKSLRRTVHTPVDTNTAIFVVCGSNVRIAKSLQPDQRVAATITPIETVNRNTGFSGEL